jgi:hypothetical protein
VGMMLLVEVVDWWGSVLVVVWTGWSSWMEWFENLSMREWGIEPERKVGLSVRNEFKMRRRLRDGL